ncbi:unnamed protein product [Musa acuminata var. zebrina]
MFLPQVYVKVTELISQPNFMKESVKQIFSRVCKKTSNKGFARYMILIQLEATPIHQFSVSCNCAISISLVVCTLAILMLPFVHNILKTKALSEINNLKGQNIVLTYSILFYVT